MQEVDITGQGPYDPIFNLILQAMCTKDDDTEAQKAICSRHPYHIEFKINGVEIDFKLVAERLSEQTVHMSKQMATDMLAIQMNDIKDEVDKLHRAIMASRKKLFPDYRDYE